MPLSFTLPVMPLWRSLLLLLPLMAIGSAHRYWSDHCNYWNNCAQPYTLTPGSDCFRECSDNDVRYCHFEWEVAHYQTLSRACYDCPTNTTDCWRPHCVPGDGYRRLITTVNKQMPGPQIQVCKGDHIVVDVHNSIAAGSLTIHWHGLTQRAYEGSQGTPYMDGVPGVTQCPIFPGQDFRYDMVASEAGTHWWHAHSGFHRADGVFGGIIVREPTDPHQQLYDFDLPEHSIMIDSWLHSDTASKYQFRYHGGDDDYADNMLINGRGPEQNPAATEVSQQIPYQRFKVEQGTRYRFRLINVAWANCPTTFSIDEHPFTAIATDGNPFEPVDATSLVIYPGERWDIIISTDAAMGTYWMSFFTDVKCRKATPAYQFALLEYVTDLQATVEEPDSVVLATMIPKPEFTRAVPSGVQINSYDKDYYALETSVADLRSLSSLPSDMRQEKADVTLYLSFQMMKLNNKHYYDDTYYPYSEMPASQQERSGIVNNITLKLPVSPLVTSKEALSICNAGSPPDASQCHDDYCECLHVEQLPLNAIVDLVFIDEGETGSEQNHPIHTHGYHFYVLAMERPDDFEGASMPRERVMERDGMGLINRNLIDPPLKDTIKVPDAGYVVARIKATNPGYWLTHCHLLFHSKLGMEMVIQVGDSKDLPSPPVTFQTCSQSATQGA